LPLKGEQSEGECTVTGWGTLSAGGSTPDVLMKVTNDLFQNFKKYFFLDFRILSCEIYLLLIKVLSYK
jgi:hypothetical protein